MVVDITDVTPFLEWLPVALLQWLLVVLLAGAAVLLLSWVFAAFRYGPLAAIRLCVHVIREAFVDLIHLSPRRILALAWLAVKESIRRRVVVVFAVFILVLLFAGWFLDPGSIDPAKLYLNFVLTATAYLLVLLSLLLSSLSLPADIKNRTLYTVVTKPVRAGEVVLGRIVGFSAIISLLLVIMGVVSYFFVVRGLNHTHVLSTENLRPLEGVVAGQPAGLFGRTSRVHRHRHKVFLDPAGRGRVEMEQGHWHELLGDWAEVLKKALASEKAEYTFGPPQGLLLARVPVYGKLEFHDRSGQPTEKGVSVGDEWTYRSYIEGGTLAAAIWTFQGITPERFPTGLPIEMTLGVFRTYKGEIEKGVPGSLALRNPQTGKKVEVRIFESKEFVIDVQHIPRTITTADGEKLDLFKDLVSDDGRVEVWLQCAAPAQYFGVAQPDLYLRARDASFIWNFIKGYFGIWLQTLLVIGLGVCFSTFLSGPVAMLATLGTLLGGLFHDFMFRLATGQTYGGGPFESIIRILTQQNMVSEMEPGLRTTVAQTLDQAASVGLWLLAAILPEFGRFSFAGFVADGFNVPGDTVLTYTCRAFAFLIPVFFAGYLCLKNREVAGQ